MLQILSLKLNVGQFPHLADLVTRINYNYFYMSDGGSLKTTSGSDAIASKLGKAFQVRTQINNISMVKLDDCGWK